MDALVAMQGRQRNIPRRSKANSGRAVDRAERVGRSKRACVLAIRQALAGSWSTLEGIGPPTGSIDRFAG
jgi:hypothetical protein